MAYLNVFKEDVGTITHFAHFKHILFSLNEVGFLVSVSIACSCSELLAEVVKI